MKDGLSGKISLKFDREMSAYRKEPGVYQHGTEGLFVALSRHLRITVSLRIVDSNVFWWEPSTTFLDGSLLKLTFVQIGQAQS